MSTLALAQGNWEAHKRSSLARARAMHTPSLHTILIAICKISATLELAAHHPLLATL